MKKINLLFLSVIGLLICSSCSNLNIGAAPVLKAGVSAAAGYAAYSIAPNDWTQSEKTALGFATAGATWILGEIVEGKITKDKAEAYDAGFSSGRAYGARRQYEITQQMQRSTAARGRTRLIELPAPAIPGVKQEPYNVFLEVVE